jgi:hypothetical protein
LHCACEIVLIHTSRWIHTASWAPGIRPL